MQRRKRKMSGKGMRRRKGEGEDEVGPGQEHAGTADVFAGVDVCGTKEECLVMVLTRELSSPLRRLQVNFTW